MHIHISNDGVPIYLQIMQQVRYLIASGRLVAGDEVPPIRKLAEQLLVNPNTVARAYRELERDGLLVSRQGAGTRVGSDGSPLSEAEKQRLLTQRADALVAEARQLGVPIDEVVQLIRERHRNLGSPTEDTQP